MATLNKIIRTRTPPILSAENKSVCGVEIHALDGQQLRDPSDCFTANSPRTQLYLYTGCLLNFQLSSYLYASRINFVDTTERQGQNQECKSELLDL